MVPWEECKHTHLTSYTSSYAKDSGYVRPPPEKRAAAATLTGRVPRSGASEWSGLEMYPAPIVLPGDDLALDPTYPAQSLRSWDRSKDRNPVTEDRSMIYVAAPPDVSEATFMQPWCEVESSIPTPSIEDVREYLQAFYHGLRVEHLQVPFRFVEWTQVDDTRRSKARSTSSAIRYVGLAHGMESTRIRVRHGSKNQDSIFSHQLNLNDLIDGMIEALPSDAYALVLLVQHDLYEDDDDAFVCGRAYGGSRVALVSFARYNPSLDEVQQIDRSHPWPLSHCKAFVEKQCANEIAQLNDSKKPRKKTKSSLSSETNTTLNQLPTPEATPLSAAVAASLSSPTLETSGDLSGLWLSRVVRTVSHELGHCFAIDHCIYNACVMQGSASLNEDTRQPPYLCPIDLAKVLKATGASEKEQSLALLQFCTKHKDVQMFSALEGWLMWKLARGIDTT
jgi:archaemetzincin